MVISKLFEFALPTKLAAFSLENGFVYIRLNRDLSSFFLVETTFPGSILKARGGIHLKKAYRICGIK